MMKAEGLEVQNACAWPSWQTTMKASTPYKSADDNSTIIDESYRRPPLSISIGHWVGENNVGKPPFHPRACMRTDKDVDKVAHNCSRILCCRK